MTQSSRSDEPTVRDLLDRLNGLAPFWRAEEWDNVGLLVGERSAPVRGVLVALDLRDHVLDEAERTGCDVILTHHPVIFPSMSRVIDTDPVGRLVLRAARARIAVVAAHTNLDSAAGGLNDVMAALMGMEETRPLREAEPHSSIGLGRVGRVDGTLGVLVERATDAFGEGAVTGVVGDPDRRITSAALCTGSGGSFIDDAREAGADVYITGDLKYHDADRAGGMALICAAHGAVESECLRRWVGANADILGVPVRTAGVTTDPWRTRSA